MGITARVGSIPALGTRMILDTSLCHKIIICFCGNRSQLLRRRMKQKWPASGEKFSYIVSRFENFGGEGFPPSAHFRKLCYNRHEPHRSKPPKNPEKNIGSNHILILGEENFLIPLIIEVMLYNIFIESLVGFL